MHNQAKKNIYFINGEKKLSKPTRPYMWNVIAPLMLHN